MTLALTAAPQMVAREQRNANGSSGWAWEISEHDQVVLRAMVRAGDADTYQKRGAGGVALFAWDRKAAEAASALADKARVRTAANERRRTLGMAIRVYRPPARWTAGPTLVPYAGEPAAWG